MNPIVLLIVGTALVVWAVTTQVEGSTGLQSKESATIVVDRTRKGDRVKPAISRTEAMLPIGCEPPFSRLTRLAPTTLNMRCVT
jgi:hypothetical protein